MLEKVKKKVYLKGQVDFAEERRALDWWRKYFAKTQGWSVGTLRI